MNYFPRLALLLAALVGSFCCKDYDRFGPFAKPSVHFYWTADCDGTVHFFVDSLYQATELSWSFGDDSTLTALPDSQHFSHKYGSNGPFEVVLTASAFGSDTSWTDTVLLDLYQDTTFQVSLFPMAHKGQANFMHEMPNGNLLVVGDVEVNADKPQIFVAMLDVMGNKKFEFPLPVSGFSKFIGYGAGVQPDGSFLVFGECMEGAKQKCLLFVLDKTGKKVLNGPMVYQSTDQRFTLNGYYSADKQAILAFEGFNDGQNRFRLATYPSSLGNPEFKDLFSLSAFDDYMTGFGGGGNLKSGTTDRNTETGKLACIAYDVINNVSYPRILVYDEMMQAAEPPVMLGNSPLMGGLKLWALAFHKDGFWFGGQKNNQGYIANITLPGGAVKTFTIKDIARVFDVCTTADKGCLFTGSTSDSQDGQMVYGKLDSNGLPELPPTLPTSTTNIGFGKMAAVTRCGQYLFCGQHNQLPFVMKTN